MNCVPPAPGFLQGLREECDRAGAVLIFDEVMTGFRVALGGAQALYGVRPDLTTLGKIIGGGMPVGAFGGRRDIMERLAPLGPVYQAGTLSGNPVAMVAGLTTLELIAVPGFHNRLGLTTDSLMQRLKAAAAAADIPLATNHVCGMFGSSSRASATSTRSPRSWRATWSASGDFFTPCWTPACISRRRPSKRDFSRRRIQLRTSTRPWRRRSEYFPDCTPPPSSWPAAPDANLRLFFGADPSGSRFDRGVHVSGVAAAAPVLRVPVPPHRRAHRHAGLRSGISNTRHAA